MGDEILHTRSERHFHRELDVSWPCTGGNNTYIARADRRSRDPEIGMVEYIEKFPLELGCYPFPDLCPLYESQIPILRTWPDQNISTGGSKARCPVRKSLCQRVRSKAGGIKPFRNGLRAGAVAYAIGPR